MGLIGLNPAHARTYNGVGCGEDMAAHHRPRPILITRFKGGDELMLTETPLSTIFAPSAWLIRALPPLSSQSGVCVLRAWPQNRVHLLCLK